MNPIHLDEITLKSPYFRRVLSTTPTMQLVTMCLLPGQEIGTEVHPYITQFIKIVSGSGSITLNGISYDIFEGMSSMIPLGVRHNIINTSDTDPLKLYTLYSPPEHPSNRVDGLKPTKTPF